MKIFIGADHRGFELKAKLLDSLKSSGSEVQDCGAFEYDQTDDYPDFATEVANQTTKEEGSRGIVICGSGAGADVTANKIKGIRSSIGFDVKQIEAARKDDDLNILALASNFTDEQTATSLVKAFLETNYEPTETHQRRLEKIKNLE